MKRRREKAPTTTVYALGRCHLDCRFCSIEWFRWLKGQMSRKWGGERFYEHAATSIRPEVPCQS